TSSGTILGTSAVNSTTSCTVGAEGLVPGQYYYLEVRSQGDYGDVGQYTINGSVSSFAYMANNTLIVSGYGNYNNQITISRDASNYTVSDNIFGGTATQTFPASQVGFINVILGSGSDSLNYGGGNLDSMVDVRVNLGGGFNSLTVDDSANLSQENYEGY